MHLGITENQHSDSRGDIKETGPRELDQRLGKVPSRQKDSHCKGCGVTALAGTVDSSKEVNQARQGGAMKNGPEAMKLRRGT